MTLGTTLLSLVRSRVVAQFERCRCPILYSLVPNFFSLFPQKAEKLDKWAVFTGVNFLGFSRHNFEKSRKFL